MKSEEESPKKCVTFRSPEGRPPRRVASLEDIRAPIEELISDSDCDIPPASPTCTTSSEIGTINSCYRWADSSQTLVFLDWDDTLFPTTQLFDLWGLPSDFTTWSTLELSDEQEQLLERWSTALMLYLKNVCSVSGRCVIVTNAKRPWVTKCIDRFAPSLCSIFSRFTELRVVYAREAMESKRQKIANRLYPGSSRGNPVKFVNQEVLQEDTEAELTRAKLAAMRKEATSFYSQYAGQTWKNILSVGDAPYEHNAVWDLAFRRKAPKNEMLRRKTVITPHVPFIRDLTYRLGFARLLYPAYIKYDGDFDIDLRTPEDLQRAMVDVIGIPDLAKYIRPMPLPAEEEDAILAEELEEVEMLLHERTARQLSCM